MKVTLRVIASEGDYWDADRVETEFSVTSDVDELAVKAATSAATVHHLTSLIRDAVEERVATREAERAALEENKDEDSTDA